MDTTEYSKKLDDIEKALERMNKSTYGICVLCSAAINKDAMLTNPLRDACNEHGTVPVVANAPFPTEIPNGIGIPAHRDTPADVTEVTNTVVNVGESEDESSSGS